MAALSTLNLPRVPRVQFESNFIQTAVCELRFPTLLEIESEAPTKLQHALRKEYPIYETGSSVGVGFGGVDSSKNYRFISKKKSWVVVLSAHSLSITTTQYENFEDFRDRLQDLIKRAVPELDTDFFTRVGLRYVNHIPLGTAARSELGEYVNRDLIAPLIDGVYGVVETVENTVRGQTDQGGYSFRNGLSSNARGETVYNIDFDWYAENVPVDDTIALVSDFSEKNFQFFHWCLGPKSLESLGAPETKEEGR